MKITTAVTTPGTTALTTRDHNPTPVIMVLDASGSMYTRFPNATVDRLTVACQALQQAAVDIDVKRTSVGVVLFSSEAEITIKPTNRPALIRLFDPARSSVTGGGTAYDIGLNLALNLKPRRLVLLSDGAPTCPVEQIWRVVKRAISMEVPIDTIGIADADASILKDIAERTGGTYKRANSLQELAHTFRDSLLRLEHRT